MQNVCFCLGRKRCMWVVSMILIIVILKYILMDFLHFGVCVFEVWNKHNEPHRANHLCFKVMLWPSEAGRLTLPEGVWEEGHCWRRIYVFRNPRLRGQEVCENTVSRTSQGTHQLWCPIWASVNLCDLPSRVPFFPTPYKVSKSTSVTNPQKMQSSLALSSACSSEIECN